MGGEVPSPLPPSPTGPGSALGPGSLRRRRLDGTERAADAAKILVENLGLRDVSVDDVPRQLLHAVGLRLAIKLELALEKRVDASPADLTPCHRPKRPRSSRSSSGRSPRRAGACASGPAPPVWFGLVCGLRTLAQLGAMHPQPCAMLLLVAAGCRAEFAVCHVDYRLMLSDFPE